MRETTDKGLGRLPAADARDRGFLLRTALEAGIPPPAPEERMSYSLYDRGWWGDQGSTSQCVAYSWIHWLEDSPITRPETKGWPLLDPEVFYKACQKVDEWPGEDYDGTSVRAGAKVLQTLGLLTEYRWGETVDEVVDALSRGFPSVLGVDWTFSMFETRWESDAQGTKRELLVPDYDTGIAGGHALIANGYNRNGRVVRLKNSWGREWGDDGRCWIRFEDLAVLLRNNGEACIGLEVRGPSPGVLNP